MLLSVGLASPAAIYLYRHIKHDPSRRDITQPPENLSWRSGKRFAINAALLLIVAALAVVVWTPKAERFAQTALFLPPLLGVLGGYVLKRTFDGWRKGEMAALMGEASGIYSQDAEPRLYWASLAWNALLGLTLLLVAPQTWSDAKRKPCFGDAESTTPSDGIAACDLYIDDEDRSPSERAAGLRARGRWHDKNGQDAEALADFDRSVESDNSKPLTFYDRARFHAARGHDVLAREDLNSALLLDPNFVDALFERGLAKFDEGNTFGAIEDFDRADSLRPRDEWILANRGLAYAWTGDAVAARRDLAAARKVDGDNFVAARGYVVLSFQAGNYRDAVRRLNTILEARPQDRWARQIRAQAYMKLGDRASARADEARLKAD